jgi:hypothetical protein
MVQSHAHPRRSIPLIVHHRGVVATRYLTYLFDVTGIVSKTDVSGMVRNDQKPAYVARHSIIIKRKCFLNTWTENYL